MRAFARRDPTDSIPGGVASDRFGGIFAHTPRGQPPAAERRFPGVREVPTKGRVDQTGSLAGASRMLGSPVRKVSVVRVFEANPNSQVVVTTFSSGSPRTKRSMFRATSRERRSMVPSVRGEQ